MPELPSSSAASAAFTTPSTTAPSSSAPRSNMLPPPEVEYVSREKLEDAVQTFARGQGYAVTVKRSTAGVRVYLKCDRGGVHVPKVGEECQRQSSSRRINCPFLLSGNFSKKRGNWKLKVLKSSHNHEPSLHPSGHSTHRKLTSEEADVVKDMTLAGVKPLGILSAIRKANKGTLVNLSTLYNVRLKVRQNTPIEKTPIQALLDDLQASDFTHFHRCDDDGTITSLFFAHRESVRLARQYHHVVLMDCTYKTNKYGLPLLHIAGMTSFNSYFSIGFCFLKEEKQNDYMWALSKLATIMTPQRCPAVIVTDRELSLMVAIDEVFPSSSHLLCLWNINKNILAKCKRQSETCEEWTVFLQKWNILVAANTEAEYDEQWKELSDCFKRKPKVLEYLSNTWLIYKERFVNAWTSKCLHFGNKATSRGAHTYVKKFLQAEAGDLLSGLNNLTLALERQVKNDITHRSGEKLRHLSGLPSIFTPVSGIISAFALKKCLAEFERKKEERSCSTMVFTSTMGIPCAHKLKEIENSKRALTKNDFHEQWHLDWRHDTMEANDEVEDINVEWNAFEKQVKEIPGDQQKVLLAQTTQLLEGRSTMVELKTPEIQTNTRGRLPGSRNLPKSSATRDLSKPKHMEKESPNKKRKCGSCGQPGHYKRTCQFQR